MSRYIDAKMKNGQAVPNNPESVRELVDESNVFIVAPDSDERRLYMGVGVYGGGALGIASLVTAIVDYAMEGIVPDGVAIAIVAIWIIAPPIFWWWDWVRYSGKNPEKDVRDDAKHTQELSRNIWFALAVILIAAFEIGEIITP
ncbi:MAG: hypothetical protein AAF483_23525 [Planctomycetota bacterium]